MEFLKPDSQFDEAKHKEDFTKAIRALPLDIRLKAIAIEYINTQKKQLDEELDKKIRELQIEFEKKSEPIYQLTKEIINGKQLPSTDDFKEFENYFTKEELDNKSELLKEGPIEDFWLKVLKNSPPIKEMIYEKDEEILKKLNNIEIKREENSENFSIIFHFDENEYFTNKQLVKKAIYSEDGELLKFEGTTIEWKEGKNITVKKVTKKQKNKKTGQSRVTTKEVDAESFFNFFKNSEPSEEDEDDSEGEGAPDDRFTIDCDIARYLSEEVVPYALDFYLGILEEEEEEEDDDDYEDVESDEEEEEEQKPKGKGKKKNVEDDDDEDDKGKKGKKKVQGDGGKQECKQQ